MVLYWHSSTLDTGLKQHRGGYRHLKEPVGWLKWRRSLFTSDVRIITDHSLCWEISISVPQASFKPYKMWRGQWKKNVPCDILLEPFVWNTVDNIRGGWEYLQLLAGSYKHHSSPRGSLSSNPCDASLLPVTDRLSHTEYQSFPSKR